MDDKAQVKWIVTKDGQRASVPMVREAADAEATKLRTKLQESAKPGGKAPVVEVKQNLMG